jgi:opacity protein-like surface antigen
MASFFRSGKFLPLIPIPIFATIVKSQSFKPTPLPKTGKVHRKIWYIFGGGGILPTGNLKSHNERKMMMKKMFLLGLVVLLLLLTATVTMADVQVNCGYLSGQSNDNGFKDNLSGYLLGASYTADAFKLDGAVLLDDNNAADLDVTAGLRLLGGDTYKLYLNGEYVNMAVNNMGSNEITDGVLVGLDLICKLNEKFTAEGVYGYTSSASIRGHQGAEMTTWRVNLDYNVSDNMALYLNYRNDKYSKYYDINWDAITAGLKYQF